MSDDPGAHIAKLYEMVGELHGRLERMHRQGTVTDVDYSDATKPRARIQIGTDDQGQPVKGPWAPIMALAGARKVHAPVTQGQAMLHVSPDGNLENGVLIPLGFSQPNPSPSTDPSTHVDQLGQLTLGMKDGKHQAQAGTETQHLVTTEGQRLKVQDISKLVIKIGDAPYILKMDALQPASDIADF